MPKFLLCFSFTLYLIVGLSISPAEALPSAIAAAECKEHCHWIGNYPDNGKFHLFNDKTLMNVIAHVVDNRTLRHIVNYNDAHYLEEPIVYLAGYYIFRFIPNYHRSNQTEPVVILVNDDLTKAHSVVERTDSRKPDWTHYGEAMPPPALVVFVNSLF